MNKSLQFGINVKSDSLNFSFDEIILEFKAMMHDRGYGKILSFICKLIDLLLCQNIPENLLTCCHGPNLVKYGSYQRSIDTSLGKLCLGLTRMKCKCCLKTMTPFLDHFKLKKRKHSYELEKIIVETVCDQSYRRSVKVLNSAGDIQITKTKAHRIVVNSEICKQNLKVTAEIDSILADGTGYKAHPNNKFGELRVVIGMDKFGNVIPISTWIRASWKKIGKDIQRANHPNKKLAFKPIANTLITDGEIGLIEGLKHLAYNQQRCVWHFLRDFSYVFTRSDDGTKVGAKNYSDKIANLLHKSSKIETEEQKTTLIREIYLAEKKLEELAAYLLELNYKSSYVYLMNAKDQLFTYLKVMLKRDGLAPPSVTSRLERLMREFARRFKRIAFNWSEKGAENLSRTMLKFIFDKTGWKKFWDEKMKLSGNLKISFQEILPT